MSLDLYQLKTFFILGKVLSFSETANIMCVTQSAVSHSIKKLEESMETTLIYRKGKSSCLTAEGKELFKTCESIFYMLDNVEENIQVIKNKTKNTINLGCQVEFGTTFLIRYIAEFLKNKSDFRINFLFSHHLDKPFINDEVDIIIDCKPHDFVNTMKIPLFVEHYVTIASKDYLNEMNIKHLEDLKNATILSLDKNANWWNNFLSVIPHKSVFSMQNVMVVNHIRGMINCAIQGLGIAFVPYYTVTNELRENVLINPFTDVLPESDNFCIYIKNEKHFFNKNKTLINYLTSVNYDCF